MSDDLHSLIFGVKTGITSIFACLPLSFPGRINWKSTIKIMNSVSFQTSCGFLVDSPVELSGL